VTVIFAPSEYHWPSVFPLQKLADGRKFYSKITIFEIPLFWPFFYVVTAEIKPKYHPIM